MGGKMNPNKIPLILDAPKSESSVGRFTSKYSKPKKSVKVDRLLAANDNLNIGV